LKNPDSSNWTDRNAEEWVRKAVKKVEDKLVAELRKHLPVADPKLTPLFLEEVKAHYEKFDEPEMLQEKLYMLATSAMPPKMMVKWLQRWNSSAAIRDAYRFPKAGFGDAKFPEWLNRATWWAQVSIGLSISFCHLPHPQCAIERMLIKKTINMRGG
jgi:hypothetical protein